MRESGSSVPLHAARPVLCLAEEGAGGVKGTPRCVQARGSCSGATCTAPWRTSSPCTRSWRAASRCRRTAAAWTRCPRSRAPSCSPSSAPSCPSTTPPTCAPPVPCSHVTFFNGLLAQRCSLLQRCCETDSCARYSGQRSAPTGALGVWLCMQVLGMLWGCSLALVSWAPCLRLGCRVCENLWV